MRILEVSDSRTWSGGTQQVLLLCQELSRLGENVALVTNTESELEKRARATGLKVKPIRMRQDYDLLAAWKIRGSRTGRSFRRPRSWARSIRAPSSSSRRSACGRRPRSAPT